MGLLVLLLLKLCAVCGVQGRVSDEQSSALSVYHKAVRELQSGAQGSALSLLHSALDLALSEQQPQPRLCNEIEMALGRLYKRTGRIVDAERHLRSTVARDPRFTAGWTQLGHLLNKVGRPGPARDAYAAAVDIEPNDPHLLFFKADSLLKLADSPRDGTERPQDLLEAAVQTLERSLKVLRARRVPPSAVQGRRTLVWARAIDALGGALEGLGRHEDAMNAYGRAVSMGVWSSPYLRHRMTREFRVENPIPVFTRDNPRFPAAAAAALQAQADVLAVEAEKLNELYEAEPENLSVSGEWKVIPLLQSHELDRRTRRPLWSEALLHRAPTLVRVLEGIPGFISCLERLGSCDAFLSRVRPGAHILPHCGPTNERQRIHLTIYAPENGRYKLRVADASPVVWETGKIVVFDDAFEHEVVDVLAGFGEEGQGLNQAKFDLEEDQDRVVLSVDVWNPGLEAGIRNELLQLDAAHGATRSSDKNPRSEL